MLKIRYSIRLRMSIIRNSTDALRMSNIRHSTNGRSNAENIRHSTDGRSNVENPTSEEGRFGCRIFDIRRRVLRMSNIRHSTEPGAETTKKNYQCGTKDSGLPSASHALL